MNVTAKHVSEALDDTSVLESDNTKGQETESNATVEAVEASEEVKEQMRLLVAENKKLYEKAKSLEAWKEEAAQAADDEVKAYCERIDQLEEANENKLNAIHLRDMKIEQLRNMIDDKKAEIGALQSNNEDLHATIDRMKEEMAHVKRELAMATEEVDAVRVAKPQLAEIAEPIRSFPADEEKQALRTLVKLWA